jgi:hypothetical protein
MKPYAFHPEYSTAAADRLPVAGNTIQTLFNNFNSGDMANPCPTS